MRLFCCPSERHRFLGQRKKRATRLQHGSVVALRTLLQKGTASAAFDRKAVGSMSTAQIHNKGAGSQRLPLPLACGFGLISAHGVPACGCHGNLCNTLPCRRYSTSVSDLCLFPFHHHPQTLQTKERTVSLCSAGHLQRRRHSRSILGCWSSARTARTAVPASVRWWQRGTTP